MSIFQDKLLTRTYCDKAGDYAVPNVFNPRVLVFRPDIGHKLDHYQKLVISLTLDLFMAVTNLRSRQAEAVISLTLDLFMAVINLRSRLISLALDLFMAVTNLRSRQTEVQY